MKHSNRTRACLFAVVLVAGLGGCGLDDVETSDGIQSADDQTDVEEADVGEFDEIALDEEPLAGDGEAPSSVERIAELLLVYHYPNPVAVSSRNSTCAQGYH